MRIAVLCLAGLLASCSTIVPNDSDASGVNVALAAPVKITYSTSPCFGTCPAYSVTVYANGRGNWEGQRHVAVEGERAFTLPPAQFAEFVRRLAPWRPNGNRSLVTQEECPGPYVTDLPSVDIVWTRVNGAEDHLSYYYGCDMEKNRKMAEDLRTAVDALPIQGYIGK